jgi:hypothetical protein
MPLQAPARRGVILNEDVSMKALAATLVLLSTLGLSLVARADPSATVDGVTYLPVITVYGRPNRPSVVVELTRPTAASAARAAHEAMRVRLIQASEPATLHVPH